MNSCWPSRSWIHCIESEELIKVVSRHKYKWTCSVALNYDKSCTSISVVYMRLRNTLYMQNQQFIISLYEILTFLFQHQLKETHKMTNQTKPEQYQRKTLHNNSCKIVIHISQCLPFSPLCYVILPLPIIINSQLHNIKNRIIIIYHTVLQSKMKANQFRQQLPGQQTTVVAAKNAKTKLQAGQGKPRLSKSDTCGIRTCRVCTKSAT